MKLGRRYLREHSRAIVMYLGFVLIFWLVFFLYDIRSDAVRYAFLLSFVWISIMGGADFLSYRRNIRALEERKRQILSDMTGLPGALSCMEEKYQEILVKMYEEKQELESRSRIEKQDMEDYYGMWVHQIKTPIAAMNVLLQSGKKEDEADLAYEKELRIELFKIEQYVEMVLTYLRMGEMSSDLSFEEYSLDDIIRQAVRKYSPMFILQKIKLDYRPVNRKVLTDEKWLKFVIEQLLSNALKYTKQGSISIYMKEWQGKEKVLVIEDTGIGICPEDLPRVFEKGFTGYNGRTDKKSTGIGLYLCKSVMNKLRHGIWIDSEMDRGTRVYLSLEREMLKVE